MKFIILFILSGIFVAATAQFELATPLKQFLSGTPKLDDRINSEDYIKLNRYFQRDHHLLRQFFIKSNYVVLADNSSAECYQSINYLLNGNFNRQSLKFLDAWGSIPTGILYGHLEDLGNFNECLSAKLTIGPDEKQIRGKYALISMTVENTTSYLNGLVETALKIGTCFPNTCNDATINNILQKSIENIAGLAKNNSNTRLKISVPFSKVEIDYISFSASSIIAITIFSIIGALMVLSTIYEYVMLWRKFSCNHLLMAFSILTNVRKLFHINTNATSNSNIECLNGLRVFSMIWIVYGHTHSEYVAYPLINKIEILKYLKDPFSILLQTSPYAVDSFLLMSGLVITWVGLKKMEKTNGKLNIPLMYFHRYIRLTPVLAAAILLAIGIWPLIEKGPMLFDWTLFEKSCEKNWWINLLYLNNYWNKYEMCLPQSWYLAVDMQLFLISPLILMGLWRWKSNFLWILLTVLILSVICCLTTMITHNFNGIIAHGLYDPEYVTTIHMATHIRMPSWIVGVILGYLMHSNQNVKQRLNGGQLTFGWIVAVALIITVTYVPYHISKDLAQATLVDATFFAALGRIAWSLGLSWVIYTCHFDYSRTLNSFLSYSGWQPIARLTYCMYIFSFMCQIVNAACNRTDAYFSAFNIIQSSCGELLITMGCAVLIVLAFESPIIAIEKYLLEQKKR